MSLIDAMEKSDTLCEPNLLCSDCFAVVEISKLLKRQRKQQDVNENAQEVFPHCRSLGEFRDSANSGCHLCSLLIEAMIENGNLVKTDGGELHAGSFSSPSLVLSIGCEEHAITAQDEKKLKEQEEALWRIDRRTMSHCTITIYAVENNADRFMAKVSVSRTDESWFKGLRNWNRLGSSTF